MTVHTGHHEDLVPLPIGFDAALWGYRRDQVRHYVRDAEFELRTVAVDRDAALAHADRLRRHLEAARAENRRLRARVDRMCRRPLPVDAAGDLARRVVELAHEEAAQITAQARAATEQGWAEAAASAARLARRHQWLLGELDARRRAMEREHRQLVEKTEAHLVSVTSTAEHRRRELDERADRQRKQIQSDFTAAMSMRRAESLARLAEREQAAEALAANAADQVAALHAQRDRVLAELRAVQRALTEATTVVTPPTPDHRPAFRPPSPRASTDSRVAGRTG
ncbi:metallopeptidase [Actinosynnema sp. NPDC050436]|uniref:metallopeptidase n=1 Tax=Actinosynnema sp. NPDC050436 TaxID=3155659 RepID=UPI0033F93AA7